VLKVQYWQAFSGFDFTILVIKKPLDKHYPLWLYLSVPQGVGVV